MKPMNERSIIRALDFENGYGLTSTYEGKRNFTVIEGMTDRE